MIKYSISFVLFIIIFNHSLIVAAKDKYVNQTGTLNCAIPQECRHVAELNFENKNFMLSAGYLDKGLSTESDPVKQYIDKSNIARALYNQALTDLMDEKYSDAVVSFNLLKSNMRTGSFSNHATKFGLNESYMYMLSGYANLRAAQFNGAISDFRSSLLKNPNNERVQAFINIAKVYIGHVRTKNIHPYNWFEKYAIKDLPKPSYIKNMNVFAYEQKTHKLPHCEPYIDKNAGIAYTLCLNPSLTDEPISLPEMITLPTNMDELLFANDEYLEMIVPFIKNNEDLLLTSTELINRGDIKAQRGFYEEAVKDYSQAIDTDIDNPDAYLHRSTAWEKMGDTGHAVRDLEKYAKIMSKLNMTVREDILERLKALKRTSE